MKSELFSHLIGFIPKQIGVVCGETLTKWLIRDPRHWSRGIKIGAWQLRTPWEGIVSAPRKSIVTPQHWVWERTQWIVLWLSNLSPHSNWEKPLSKCKRQWSKVCERRWRPRKASLKLYGGSNTSILLNLPLLISRIRIALLRGN